MGEPSEKDIWRDTPVRLLGYANEVGESFRPIFPKFLVPSYALAIGYTFCDCADKGKKAYKAENNKITQLVIASSIDALVWQLLASVAIPGFMINRIVHLSEKQINKRYASGAKIRGLPVKYVPIFLGLSTIPFIVEPIDHFTTVMMNHTLRKFLALHKQGPH